MNPPLNKYRVEFLLPTGLERSRVVEAPDMASVEAPGRITEIVRLRPDSTPGVHWTETLSGAYSGWQGCRCPVCVEETCQRA